MAIMSKADEGDPLTNHSKSQDNNEMTISDLEKDLKVAKRSHRLTLTICGSIVLLLWGVALYLGISPAKMTSLDLSVLIVILIFMGLGMISFPITTADHVKACEEALRKQKSEMADDLKSRQWKSILGRVRKVL